MKRVKLERKRKTDAENARYYAQRYKEAEAKARRLEEERFGSIRKETEDSSSDSTARAD
jgi:hypothetical protein